MQCLASYLAEDIRRQFCAIAETHLHLFGFRFTDQSDDNYIRDLNHNKLLTLRLLQSENPLDFLGDRLPVSQPLIYLPFHRAIVLTIKISDQSAMERHFQFPDKHPHRAGLAR